MVNAEHPRSRRSAPDVLLPGDRRIGLYPSAGRDGGPAIACTDTSGCWRRPIGTGWWAWVVRTCARSLIETKPASVNLLRRFSIQRKGPCAMRCVLSVDDVRGEPRPDTSRPEFRFPISGYSYGAARQSYEFGAAAHGLPTGCHSPGVGRPRSDSVCAGLRIFSLAPTRVAPLRCRSWTVG